MLVYWHCAYFSKYYGIWIYCEWFPLEYGVVNILTIDDMFTKKNTERVQKIEGVKFVVLICKPISCH